MIATLSWPPVSRNVATNSIRRWASSVARHAYKLDADYVPYHDNIDWLRNTRHGYEAEVFTDLDNDVVNTKQQFNLASLYLESQDIVGVSVSVTDRPDADFEITDGSAVPAGNYDWWEARVYGYSACTESCSCDRCIVFGGFYDGTRQQISIETFTVLGPSYLLG